MAKNSYYINEDPECMHALALVRRYRLPSETEEEAAKRILDDRLLAVWLKDRAIREDIES